MLLKSRPNLGAAMTCLEVCHCIGNSTVAIPSGPVTNAIPRRSGGRFAGPFSGPPGGPTLVVIYLSRAQIRVQKPDPKWVPKNGALD